MAEFIRLILYISAFALFGAQAAAAQAAKAFSPAMPAAPAVSRALSGFIPAPGRTQGKPIAQRLYAPRLVSLRALPIAQRLYTPRLVSLRALPIAQRLYTPRLVSLKALPIAQRLYEEKIGRLAEILGALHYLDNLCGAEHGQKTAKTERQNTQWRDFMQKFIAALPNDAKQKARLYAAFNRSYAAFADNYRTCTPSAREALARYRLEGQNLSRDLPELFSGDAPPQ